MSLILRSLLRDPFVTRPLSRALRRRLDDDIWSDEWRPRRVRRALPVHDSPALLMDAMNRQMDMAMNRMQEFAEDLDELDSFVGRLNEDHQPEPKRRRSDSIVKRTESGGLQLALDVSDYKPEDLKIKLVDDNLVVEAISESSAEDSYSRNHFKRWFKLPQDCKLEDIRSKLTRDNKLVIELPTKKPLGQKGQNIPIEMEQASDNQQTSQHSNRETESNDSK